MKAKIGDNEIIIGKRVTLGAMISSVAAIFAHFDPENAAAYVSAAIPITFIAQVIVANWMSITVPGDG